METIRQWLLGVAACAMLVSAAEALCPDAAARQAARLTGGLLILCALLRPLAAWDAGGVLRGAADYRAAVTQAEDALARTAHGAFADGIARELDAYIEDKAETMGAAVRAEVRTDSRGVPEGVTLRGAYCEALSDWIETELGVAKEKQEWIEG